MKTKLNFATLIVILILNSGCHTAERMLDQGRYDELLSLAQRKMSGKKIKKEKYVRLVEEAFEKITDRDMDRIERLKAGNRSDDWEEIVAIARRIDRRQERLEPFLPLVDENGYQASFTFVKTEDIIQYAENQLVASLYEEGLSYLKSGRTGNKVLAQSAYHKFKEVLVYRTGYREALALRDEARQLGIAKVLLRVENRARQYMPAYVAEVLEDGIAVRDAFWTQYYTTDRDDIEIDYVARLVVNVIEVGPDAIREERIPRSKKIEDGWEYVLDAKGNVAKDSLGNDIKRTRYTEIHAILLKSHQEKGVILRGLVELQDAHSGQTLETRPVQVESRFYHLAQTFFGDDRALDQADRINVGLVPFPGDESMMLEVAELARPVFTKELSKYF